MNDSDASYTEDRPNVILGPTLVLISAIGTTGNGLVLYVYKKSTRIRDTTMMLLMNLALTDLFTSITLGVNGIGVTLGIVNNSYIMCLAMMLIPTFMFFVSQGVLGITTFDRFIAICHHEKYTRIMTKTTLRILLLIAWLLPLLMIGVPFLGFNYWDIIQTCRYRNLFHEWVYFTNSLIIIILMSISAVLYVQILKKAWEFYRRFRPAQVSGVNAESNKIRAKQRAIKNGKVMGIVTLFFTVCWLPSHIYQFWYGLEFEGNSALIGITITLGTLNCIINPFIYAWQKEDFRKEGKKFLKCCRRQHFEGRDDKHQKDVIPKDNIEKESPFDLNIIQVNSPGPSTASTISKNLSAGDKPLDNNQRNKAEDIMSSPHVADE
ncbi:hypothetical protein FSP39_019041 [Pinctada imbricata]|uniref:G-protein coupled receptors family 1 profile domain-containing protein n=1 Tax=Pinctada imbricata TaxID=66713 RepID=A0AA88YIZ6_PINIB|nr:hypothetical protein FSP39_019041 [Pinctada imbricata]